MVMVATRAVRGPDGQLLGHVLAGVLLNRNLPFIDHINQIACPSTAAARRHESWTFNARREAAGRRLIARSGS